MPPQKLALPVTPAVKADLGRTVTYAPWPAVAAPRLTHETPSAAAKSAVADGPVPDAFPQAPLSVMAVKPTVDVQNLKPALGHAGR